MVSYWWFITAINNALEATISPTILKGILNVLHTQYSIKSKEINEILIWEQPFKAFPEQFSKRDKIYEKVKLGPSN